MSALTAIKYHSTKADGSDNAGGLLHTYVAGTTTPQATYTTSALTTPNANPVVLDSTGRASIWLDPALAYKFVATDSAGVAVPDGTVDNWGPEPTSALAADLASTDSGEGSGLLGHSATATYAAATVGRELQRIYWLGSLGAVGNDTTDDSSAIQAAIDLMPSGGVLLGERGKTYKCNTAPVIKAGVCFDLQGAELHLTLNGGNLRGVSLRSKAVLQNGTVRTTSTGTPGSSGSYHTAVTIGPSYGDSPSTGSISPEEGAVGWTVRNMTLSTDRADRPAVQVIGGCSGIIEDCEIPDGVCSGIHLDWGSVGNIDAGDIAGTRTRFNAGTAYTTHPNNISIRNNRIGVLTGPNSHGVRLSAVHNIEVTNTTVAGTQFAGFYHTAGDCGYEFAPVALKPLRSKAISVHNFTVKDANNGWGFFVDCEADNVAVAVVGGYSPLLPVIQRIGLVMTECTTVSDAGASVIAGFRLQKMIGGDLRSCFASGHEFGILVETGCDHLTITGGETTGNRKSGVYIGNASDLPEDITVCGHRSYGNGLDATYTGSAGIECSSTTRPRLSDNRLGIAGEATQDNGIRLDAATVTDARLYGNYVYGIQSGFAFAVGSSTNYTTLFEFAGNDCASGITNKYAGPNIVPMDRSLGADGVKRGSYRAARVALTADTTPTAGTWVAGDTILHTDPTGANTGTRCTTGGSPGTWGLF